jgi:hypothetical protein
MPMAYKARNEVEPNKIFDLHPLILQPPSITNAGKFGKVGATPNSKYPMVLLSLKPASSLQNSFLALHFGLVNWSTLCHNQNGVGKILEHGTPLILRSLALLYFMHYRKK